MRKLWICLLLAGLMLPAGCSENTPSKAPESTGTTGSTPLPADE